MNRGEFQKFVSIAFRNLRRNTRRNLATGVAITLGLVGLVILGGYAFRVFSYLKTFSIYGARAGHIVITAKDGLDNYALKPKSYSISKATQDAILAKVSQDPNVDFTGLSLEANGLAGNGCSTMPFFYRGVDTESARRAAAHPESQRWLKDLIHLKSGKWFYEYPESLQPILMSPGLRKLLHKPKVHDDLAAANQSTVVVIDCQAPDAKDKIAADANVQMVTGAWTGSLSAMDGEIVGEFSTGLADADNSAILGPLSLLQKMLDTENVSRISVWLKSDFNLDRTVDRIRRELAPYNVDVYAWNTEKISPMYTGMTGFMTTLVIFIAFVILGVVALSIFNSATMTVIERSEEIGMLRSLGFTRARIHRLYVLEVLILAALSIAAGVLLGFAVMAIINGLNIRYYPPGIAGGMQLMIIPKFAIFAAASLAVVVLAVLTTSAAVKITSKKSIPLLISGAQR